MDVTPWGVETATRASEIAAAFRAVFITIASFTGIGIWLAWSMPLRRLQ